MGHSLAGMHLLWCRTNPVLQKHPSTQLASCLSHSCLLLGPGVAAEPAYRHPNTHFRPQSWYTSWMLSTQVLTGICVGFGWGWGWGYWWCGGGGYGGLGHELLPHVLLNQGQVEFVPFIEMTIWRPAYSRAISLNFRICGVSTHVIKWSSSGLIVSSLIETSRAGSTTIICM